MNNNTQLYVLNFKTKITCFVNPSCSEQIHDRVFDTLACFFCVNAFKDTPISLTPDEEAV